jgi:putative DNA primase/helicase
MTGGDPITARFMRQDNFTFSPQFKLTIIGNHKPTLRTVDDAIRRRLNIVPFVFKPAKPDPELEQKLMAEAAGILRWMIEGCLDWQKNGLMRPQSVIDATSTYFEDEDLMKQWLQEECDVEPGNTHKWETVAKLYESWSAYCRGRGEQPETIKSFGGRMTKLGFERRRIGNAGVRGFAGLRLKPSARHAHDQE